MMIEALPVCTNAQAGLRLWCSQTQSHRVSRIEAYTCMGIIAGHPIISAYENELHTHSLVSAS